MKKTLLILLLFPLLAFGQARPAVYNITADSVRFKTLDATGAEFVLENDTRHILGVLFNYSGGRTRFDTVRIVSVNDSCFKLMIGTVQQGGTICLPISTGGGGGANTDTQRVYFQNQPTYSELCITRQGGSICVPFLYPINYVSINGDSLIVEGLLAGRVATLIPGTRDSIYVYRTYTNLYNEWQANNLVEGRKYHITDHRQIYDQSISDVTKTAALEPLVLTASSDSTFSPIAYSTLFPNDYIEYDISVDTTYVNAAAARGKITYRKDPNGNSAPFDFRHVLMYMASNASEALIYDLTLSQTSVNDLSTPGAFMGAVVSQEFPGSIFSGATFHNTNILPIASYFEGGFTQNTRGYFEGSVFEGEVTQTINVNFSSTTVAGDVSELTTLTISECTFAGNLNTSHTGTWSATTFAGAFVKEASKCGFNGSYVGGLIDRLHSCTSAGDSIYGAFYWCDNILMGGSVVRGDLRGVNNILIDTTVSNCHIKNISGITDADRRCGFDNCTIVGTSGASSLGNITMTCLITGKTIDQSTDPLLFDLTVHKTIYKQSDGDYWYWYIDDTNTIIFNDIP